MGINAIEINMYNKENKKNKHCVVWRNNTNKINKHLVKLIIENQLKHK